MILFNLTDTLNEISKTMKDFIIKYQGNPFFWAGLFCLGLALFGYTYNVLQKEK